MKYLQHIITDDIPKDWLYFLKNSFFLINYYCTFRESKRYFVNNLVFSCSKLVSMSPYLLLVEIAFVCSDNIIDKIFPCYT